MWSGRRQNRAGQFATQQKFGRTKRSFDKRDQQTLRVLVVLEDIQRRQGLPIMNRLIWLVGAVVIVLFVLGYFGLR
ncbi:MAG: hypothetical protein HIU89_11900 [Proteobacteria bacterium]|nr:hypothetical protein [Pseudomonadota bacterium]